MTNPEGFSQDVTYDSAFRIATITDSLGQVATFTYTAQGLPATMVDARGNTSRYTYDARGNRTEYFDPLDRKTTTDYDPMGRVIRVIDPRLKETEYEYDDLGRRTLMRDHDGGETRYEYDEAGNKTAEVDARNKRTEFQYDAVNRLEKIIYPDTSVRQFTNDFWGHKLTETDPVGRVTRNDYNLAGELFRVFQAFGTSEQAMTEYTYWPNGWKKTEKDPRGKITSYEYFETGWLKSMRDPLGRVTEYSYNGKGEQESMKDAKLRTTTYGYDARGRQTSVNTPDGKSVIRTYDGLGLVLTVKDEENRITTFEYDAASQLKAVIDALTQRTEYTYDDTGNKLTQKDARTNTTSYEYDNLNRRTKRTLPGGQFETSTYDAVGNMLTRTDFNGRTTQYAYDPLNRLERKTPDAVFVALPIEFTHFADGLRKSMIDVSGTTNYTYTARGQLKTKATPQGTLTYTYDLGGNVSKVVSSNANGTNVNYAWDDAGQLDSVTDNFTGATTAVDFDETGNLKTTLYANGVLHTFGYDSRDRMENLAVTKGGVLASYAYTHFATGRQKDVTEDTGRKATYAYDPIYRLLSEDITGAPSNGTLNYGLDQVGNRLSLLSTLAALPSQAFSYDANDRISGDTFDNNGNTTGSGGHSYFYDFEDRMTFQDSSVQNIYDGDGNRVARIEGGTMIRYLIDDQNPTGWAQVAEETSGGAVIAQYTHGRMRISQRRLAAPSSWQVRYYGYDGGGSVRQLFDTVGTGTDTYAYDSFGNTISRTGTTINAYQYRGEQLDAALGMYYFRARYYGPQTGRFLTQDKFEGEEGEVLTLNSYLYAKGDSANNIDPSGFANLESRSIMSSLITRVQALMPNVGMRSVTLGQVTRGARIAWDTVCCLDKAWSVLDMALVVSGIPGSPALDMIDAACKLGCKDRRDGRTFVVYRKDLPGGTYVGRASGFGSPQDIFDRRNARHHVAGPGSILYTTDSYAVARGMEQLVLAGILDVGGTVLNRLAPIAAGPKASKYIQCALRALGDSVK